MEVIGGPAPTVTREGLGVSGGGGLRGGMREHTELAFKPLSPLPHLASQPLPGTWGLSLAFAHLFIHYQWHKELISYLFIYDMGTVL